MGMSSLTVDRSTASKRKGDDLFDIEGMVFPLLKPIITTHPAPETMISCTGEQQKDDFLQDIGEVTVVNERRLAERDQDDCETPKSEEHKIPNVLECPPAPRKYRLKPRMNTSSLPDGFFFFPPDLDPAFIVYRMSQPRKKLHWSKRTSTHAIEQSGGHRM